MQNSVLARRRIAMIGLGDLGAAVATRLLDRGARVIGVRRGREAPPGVELLRADLGDPAALAALPADIEAMVISITPDHYDAEGYRRTYLAAARNLAKAMAGRPMVRTLWVSSTSVYGSGSPAPTGVYADPGGVGVEFDESIPAIPESERGRILLAAEQALAAGGWPVTAVRLAGIYGPGRSALIERVRQGRGAPSDPVHWTNRIHRDDAAEALVFLLEQAFGGTELPAVVIGSDGAAAPRHEVLAWLADRLGVTLEPVEDDGGRSPSRRLRPRVLQELGFRWCYPDYRAGYAAMLDASGKQQNRG